MRLSKLAAIFLLISLTAWPKSASAEEPLRQISTDQPDQQISSSPLSDDERQIRTYDRQIFLELVKLAEFNVRYQQTVNHCARWRKVFYPLAQEAGYACFLGYSITDISERGNAWSKPSLISQPTIKRALSAATVGAALGGTSSMVEIAADGFEALQASRKGFSVRQAVAFVQSTVKRVDDLLARRHALLETGDFTGTRRELLELKEELLKYERDRLVFEFKRWNVHSRGYTWYKNAFYAINATVNWGRFSAIQLGFKSFSQPKCTGATGPILISSACLASIGPLASSAVGNCVKSYQRRSLARKLPVEPFLTDQEARQKFERLTQLLASSETNTRHVKIASELIKLREEKLGLDTLILHEDRKIERLRRVAGQQVITAPLVSSLGATSAILNTIGYHGFRQQPLVSNKLSIAGDACVIPAESIALIATPAAALLAWRYENNLKKKGEHPDQLLAKRLVDLKALEEKVTEAWR